MDPETGEAFSGTPGGLEPVSETEVTVTDGFVRAAEGYAFLSPTQVNDASEEAGEFSIPTEDGAIRQLGISQAFEGRTTLQYDEEADTITDVETGTVYTVQRQGDREYFVDERGSRVSDQSWLANVGVDNYKRILTDEQISSDFLRIFVWTVVFATLSVVTTFLLGLALAATLNEPRLRGQKVDRALLILPYAIPGFISLLIWANFFNRDSGLINSLLGWTSTGSATPWPRWPWCSPTSGWVSRTCSSCAPAPCSRSLRTSRLRPGRRASRATVLGPACRLGRPCAAPWTGRPYQWYGGSLDGVPERLGHLTDLGASLLYLPRSSRPDPTTATTQPPSTGSTRCSAATRPWNGWLPTPMTRGCG